MMLGYFAAAPVSPAAQFGQSAGMLSDFRHPISAWSSGALGGALSGNQFLGGFVAQPPRQQQQTLSTDWSAGRWRVGSIDGRPSNQSEDSTAQRGGPAAGIRLPASPFKFVATPPVPPVGRGSAGGLPPQAPSQIDGTKVSRSGSRTTSASSRSSGVVSGGAPTPLPPPPPQRCKKESAKATQVFERAPPAPPPAPTRVGTVGSDRSSSFSSSSRSFDGASEDGLKNHRLEPWEEGGVAESCRKRLAEAALSDDTPALQEALAEAQRLGLHGWEARKARDALLALESSDFKQRVTLQVEQAVESDDWWKLQAAMQFVVGGLGGDSELVAKLKDAMRMQKKRQEATREIKRAAEIADCAQLREAIETALLVHAKETDVQRGKEALQSLEMKESLRKSLQEATRNKGHKALRNAIRAAKESDFLQCNSPLLKEDPSNLKALQSAEAVLRDELVNVFRSFLAKGDQTSAASALHDVKATGSLSEALSKTLEGELAAEGQGAKIRVKMQEALASGSKNTLTAVVAEVEASDVINGIADADRATELRGLLQDARAALRQIEAKENAEVARRRVVDDLNKTLQGDDMVELQAAIGAAENLDAGGSESALLATLASAKNKLRHLQVIAAASDELECAIKSDDLHRLRAAIAAAHSAGVCRHRVKNARAMRVRKCAVVAMIQKETDALRQCLEEGRKLGLPRQELASWESELHGVATPSLARKLREAIAAGNCESIRELAAAAAASGAADAEVAKAWERLRELEANNWLRNQLQESCARGDLVRLQTAIRQAECAGLDPAEVDAARAHLAILGDREKAKQDLRLVQSSSNFYSIQAAIRDCERLGCSKDEIAEAMGHWSGSSAAPAATTFEVEKTQLTIPPTDFGSSATNPQLGSSATLPRTYVSLNGTIPRLNSGATEVSTGVRGSHGVYGSLQSKPLKQPRPDEAPASMHDLNSTVDLISSPGYVSSTIPH